jgi:hypothetical protein
MPLYGMATDFLASCSAHNGPLLRKCSAKKFRLSLHYGRAGSQQKAVVLAAYRGWSGKSRKGSATMTPDDELNIGQRGCTSCVNLRGRATCPKQAALTGDEADLDRAEAASRAAQHRSATLKGALTDVDQ